MPTTPQRDNTGYPFLTRLSFRCCFMVPGSWFCSFPRSNQHIRAQVWPGARMRSLNRKWNRHYRFRALSEEDMRGWLDAINATSAFLGGKGDGGASQEGASQEGGSGRGSGSGSGRGSPRGSPRGSGRGLQGERRSWPYRKNTPPPSGSHTDERSEGEGKVSGLNVDTTLQSSSLAPASSSPTSAASSTSTVARYAKRTRERHHKTCTTRENTASVVYEQKQVIGESTDGMGAGGARGGLLNVNVSSRALVCLKLYCWHYTTS